jgi:hypothetical protein
VRGETTAIEEAAKRAAERVADPPVSGFLDQLMSDFMQLPLWLQLLVLAVIVVSVVQWQRRRH